MKNRVTAVLLCACLLWGSGRTVVLAAEQTEEAAMLSVKMEETKADVSEAEAEGEINKMVNELVEKTEEEARKYLEEKDAARKAAEEAKKKEEEARRKAEEEQKKAQEAARRTAEEEESKKKEEIRKKAEEESKKEAEARKRAEEESKKKEEAGKKIEEESEKEAEARKKAEEERKKEEEARKKAEEERLALRQEIVDFALQFEGNPYVYGGTSLTGGADCSGFVMSVFKEFGYELPRVAADQYSSSVQKSLEDIEPGDLVFYGDYGIDHVALYIGDGEIIHASTAATGIKISDYTYRQPAGVGTYLD